MQKVRFIVIKPEPNPTAINWQRFTAGSIVALACMLIVFTVINAVRIIAFSAPSDAPSNQPPLSATTTLTPTIPITLSTTPVGMFNATPSEANPSENNTLFNNATPIATTDTEAIDPELFLTLTAQSITLSPTAADSNHSVALSHQQTASALEANETPTQRVLPTGAPVTHVPQTPTIGATSTPQPTATNPPQPTATSTPQPTAATTTSTPQPTATSAPNTAATTAPTHTPTHPTSSTPINLPTPPKLNVFGVEINQGYVTGVITEAQKAGVDWVRYNGILWHEIETTEGAPNWAKLATFEQEVQLISNRGMIPVVVIRGTPAWAQQVNSACGPIKQDKLDAFATFVRQVVTRYSVAPYNVRYWEIGNEPDTDPTIVDPTMPFGCWGNQNDANYGGAYFADMLKKVSSTIKDVDPNATIILGGLLLDCDPNNPPINDNGDTKDCTPARFLDGILENGGSSAFDMLAYHGYSYWGLEHKDWDIEHKDWKHRGGATLGKADYLRNVMQRYNVDKPILANEIGLLCWNSDPICMEESFLVDQQNYLVRTYIRAWGNTMLAASWYTFNYPNWHEAGLLNRDRTPRPAMHTLTFLTNLFDGATFREKVSYADKTQEGYIFDKGSQELRVYWSNNDNLFDIAIPSTATTIYRFGLEEGKESGYVSTDVTGETSVQVGFHPVVVVVQK